MGTEVTAYLKEMNIPVKLYDDMLFISPENMKILTEDEISQYGLDKDDPFQAEANAARRAGDLRITRRELARREAMKKSVCNVSKCYAVLESLERIPNPLPPVCRVAFDCEEKIMKIGKP